jgi:hypothetical protein
VCAQRGDQKWASHDNRRVYENRARPRACRLHSQRSTMVPLCRRFTRRPISRTQWNRFSIRLVEDSTRSRLSGSPRRITVKVSSSPTRSEAAAQDADAQACGRDYRAGAERAWDHGSRRPDSSPLAPRLTAAGATPRRHCAFYARGSAESGCRRQHLDHCLVQRLGAVDHD